MYCQKEKKNVIIPLGSIDSSTITLLYICTLNFSQKKMPKNCDNISAINIISYNNILILKYLARDYPE